MQLNVAVEQLYDGLRLTRGVLLVLSVARVVILLAFARARMPISHFLNLNLVTPTVEKRGEVNCPCILR
jgi:hypothetical protein